MLDQILQVSRESSYDFRITANPQDPLSYLFPEWIPYYRTKWAIAKVLQPKRIIEIGVRYGYSALAFLDACPDAEYVGIDLDADTFGGSRGAVAWAKEKLEPFKATLLTSDSQKLSDLPGGSFDLVHVDGQQDGVGTLHDLHLALRAGKFVLLDGYLWTQTNCLHASDFLYKNRGLIEYSMCINGYAGDLLIKPCGVDPIGASTSGEIRHTYTKQYYEQDCGGFDSFKRSGGTRLEDARLRAVAAIARVAPRSTAKALDLGCGRGELSAALAESGFEVTAVDYSEDAIELARSVATRTGLEDRIRFRCQSVLDLDLNAIFDTVVAADLVEHLSPGELDLLYQKIASILTESGLLVIHTFPNAWYYRYGYSRRRRSAQRLGAYLSPEPRSRYELLMHINEQSPRVLARQLKKHFPYVKLWFSGIDNPEQNLLRRFTIAEMRDARDVYVVASHSEIPIARILHALILPILTAEAVAHTSVRIVAAPERVEIGQQFEFRVHVENFPSSKVTLKSEGQHPILVSYHWLDLASNAAVIYDGVRSPLRREIPPGNGVEVRAKIVAPHEPGTYRLRGTMLQEFVRWFDEHGVFDDRVIQVVDQLS